MTYDLIIIAIYLIIFGGYALYNKKFLKPILDDSKEVAQEFIDLIKQQQDLLDQKLTKLEDYENEVKTGLHHSLLFKQPQPLDVDATDFYLSYINMVTKNKGLPEWMRDREIKAAKFMLDFRKAIKKNL